MNLHEYQAKEILRGEGIPVPPFGVASHHKQVEKIIKDLHLQKAVIKIQVHAGGRGKAGGVKFAQSPEEIVKISQQLIGMKIVNNQTGPEGVIAHKVLIAAPVEIEREYYLGAIIDRSRAEAILIASPEGGMDIEEIAEKKPDRILKIPIGLDGSVKPYHLLYLSKFMGWKNGGMEIARRLAKIFIERDASLVEINPLVETKDGKLWALDAKMSIDDNALYRQPDMMSYFDPAQIDPNEVAAKKHDLSYIALDGNIGCMVNGAGLAMATMDLIKSAGGKPANFLDVGGSATAEKIAYGFKLLQSHPKVKAILVNIFGGIMNCTTIAEGILTAHSENPSQIPLVVRMEGTNVEEAKAMLEKAEIKVHSVDSLEEAAVRVVKEANHAHSR